MHLIDQRKHADAAICSGAASSVTSVEGSKELDFASVQRGNAEVQRRAQEVINACVSMGSQNPIKFIHDGRCFQRIYCHVVSFMVIDHAQAGLRRPFGPCLIMIIPLRSSADCRICYSWCWWLVKRSA